MRHFFDVWLHLEVVLMKRSEIRRRTMVDLLYFVKKTTSAALKRAKQRCKMQKAILLHLHGTAKGSGY
jgi:hypothetical protein